MRDRRGLRPLIGIGAVGLVFAGLGIVMVWLSADLQAQLFAFYTGLGPSQSIDDETYREWERISTVAYSLQSVAMPLFLVSLIAVFAILAVLARNADTPRRTAQEDVTTAS